MVSSQIKFLRESEPSSNACEKETSRVGKLFLEISSSLVLVLFDELDEDLLAYGRRAFVPLAENAHELVYGRLLFSRHLFASLYSIGLSK